MKKLLFMLALFPWFDAKADFDADLLGQMFTHVHQDYIEKVDTPKMTMDALSVITDLDGSIVISKGVDKFYIYHNKQVKKILPQPQNGDDVTAWSNTTAQIADVAIKLSEKVALRDFELPDLMIKKVIKNLDEFSHYYSEFDYEEDGHENDIYTLYSDRKIDDVLYIRVRTFNVQTALSVKGTLEQKKPYSAVVLDLRGNSGGMLNEALKVAGYFTDGEIITYTAGRDNANIHYYTSPEGSLFDGPMVIIVDGDTASAAEVIAGGLQDQSRAKIVGTQTFGKGTIQNVIKMSNGGYLALSTEQFFTPSGKIIHRVGITPDICMAKNGDNCERVSRLWEDSDVDKAIKLLKNEL